MLDRIMQCWGKTGHEEDATQFHPALFHMADVGNVARVLLSHEVSPRWKEVLARAFGDEVENIEKWIPWAVALHDIGKISSPFQAQNSIQKLRLEGLGFHLHPALELSHPVVGACYFKQAYKAALPKLVYTSIEETLAGHHGQFAPPGVIKDAEKRLYRDENPEWVELRQVAAQSIEQEFLVRTNHWPENGNISCSVMALCGFTILCDWIGSNSLYFKPSAGLPWSVYLPLSRDRAELAVQESGFTQNWVSAQPTDVSQLFKNLPSLRPLQQEIDCIPKEILSGPCLSIIEAPTGEGKTEAALALAHRIGAIRGSDEIYYALPTAATSNQMYRRLSEYLSNQLDLSVKVKLVHSQAFLIEDDLTYQPLSNGQPDPSNQAIEWFSPKKRALLAPFGVGTIDQAELCALQVRHTMLRMVGLAGKVIILDEVHAYDTYMTTIIERMLAWLSALGTSVIILSATLPQTRREQLARAYGVHLPEDRLALDRYPCIFVSGSGNEYIASPSASQPNRNIHLKLGQLSSDNPEVQAQWLLDQLGEEGCACWITNTVDRSQRLFAALDKIAPPDIKRCLIHSRFPVADRQILEGELGQLYGPNGSRPSRGIVIGTQVLEQSLDLDFDLMVSDLAPIDLLLQRAGRLHRHQRNRPRGHTNPLLWVITQPSSGKYPDLKTDQHIYHQYLLMKTWDILKGREEIDLPAGYRELIKIVYDDGEPPITQDDLYKAWKDLIHKESDEKKEATLRLLPNPTADIPFTAYMANILFEENEDKASWIVGKTRLGEETITIIPVELDGDNGIFQGLTGHFLMNKPVNKDIQLQILRQSIKISTPDLIEPIKSQQLPILFKESALLKNVYPLWLNNGRSTLGSGSRQVELILDSRLGLVIKRQKG